MKSRDGVILQFGILGRYTILMVMIISAAIIFSGCYFFPQEEEVMAPPLIEPSEVTYQTIDAKKGTIENVVTNSGNIASANEQNVYFKFRGGYLKGIYTNLGGKVTKGDVIAELDTDKLESDIKKQKLMLKKAELVLEGIKNNGGKDIDIQQAILNVELEELELEDLQLEYDKSRLTSPISGFIIYQDKLNAGDYVNANKTLVKIADPSKLLVQISIGDISSYTVGTMVEVNYGDKTYHGEVVMTPATAPLDANENLKKVVQIKVEGLPSDIKIGDSVSTRLVLERKENVIIIPRNCITKNSGHSIVQVLDKGVKYERNVETGIENATEVEIVKGLNEGDKVILR